MYIAQKYRETNIVEYVLYMWHIESLVRSLGFDMERIEKEIISKYNVSESETQKLHAWYENIASEMLNQRLKERGHLAELSELMHEIFYLHHSLLTLYQDKKYQKLVAAAQGSIDDLKAKSGGKVKGDIETAMNGLFGVLILKLRGKEVSQATQEGVKSISKMMAYLAERYNKMREGDLALPKVMEN